MQDLFRGSKGAFRLSACCWTRRAKIRIQNFTCYLRESFI